MFEEDDNLVYFLFLEQFLLGDCHDPSHHIDKRSVTIEDEHLQCELRQLQWTFIREEWEELLIEGESEFDFGVV